MATVGNLVANLSMNTTGFSRGAKRATGLMQSLSSRVSSLALGIGGSLAAAFGASTVINAARESERASKKLEAVLTATGHAAGVTSSEIKRLAADLQDVTNFEAAATVSAAGVLATLKEVKGDIFKDAIVAAQDMSSVLETDLQGSIMQIGKALNNPAKGIAALTRAGVSFTEQQKQQIETLQESGDILGAQKIIMQELQSEFGGAAKAMADPITQLKNTLGDLAETIGGAVLPAVNTMATFIKNQMDVVLFAFRNAWSLAQLAAVKAAQGMFQVFQSFGGPIRTMVAGFMAAFKNIGSAWEAMLSLMHRTFIDAQLALQPAQGKLAEWMLRLTGQGAAVDDGSLQEELEGRRMELLNARKGAGKEWDNFGNEFMKDFAKAGEGLDFAGGMIEGVLDGLEEGLLQQIATNEANRFNQDMPKIPGFAGVSEDDAAAKGQGKPLAGVAALQRGSREAFSAIQAAIRGTGKGPADKTAKNTDAMVKALQTANAHLAAIAGGPAAAGLALAIGELD